MLTIIIPTLNEEKYLPKAIDSIKKQNYECEIVIADAGSTDQTIPIAKRYQCKITRGGKQARGRNEGAKIANGDWLLFLDADIILPERFLDNCFKEIKNNGLEIATCSATPISTNFFDHLVYSLANAAVILFQKRKPFAQGFCIFIEKAIHEQIKGFDETITFGEDSEYVSRAVKYGKFGILRPKVLISVRRFEKEGRLKLALKYLYLNLYRQVKGEIRTPVNYDYGNF